MQVRHGSNGRAIDGLNHRLARTARGDQRPSGRSFTAAIGHLPIMPERPWPAAQWLLPAIWHPRVAQHAGQQAATRRPDVSPGCAEPRTRIAVACEGFGG